MTNTADIFNANILIVDDLEANVQLLEQMLRKAGYQSITSTMDSRTVCELHRKNHYDLILLDLHMPGMDGFQVMEGLKEIEIDGYIPVIVITAQPGHKLRALALGAKDFISKPFDVAEVQTRIHNMLEVRLLYKKLENYNKVLEQNAELHESEARLSHLVEMSADWYWEQNENGFFTKTYGPALEMLGLQVDDVLGKTREDHGSRWNEAERKILDANLAARRPFLNFVYSRTNPDDSLQYLMASGTPTFDTHGRFTGYRGIGKDVTEMMRNKTASAGTQKNV
ncbi:MAG: response regulator [Gallionella sp.]|nr:response regulator [Gallionella sp.]